MSIMRCEKHDRSWDSDTLEECPLCTADALGVWASHSGTPFPQNEVMASASKALRATPPSKETVLMVDEPRGIAKATISALNDSETSESSESYTGSCTRTQLWQRIRTLESMLRSAQSETVWIRCSERMPEPYDTVLLNCDGELRSTGYWTGKEFSIDAEDASDGSRWVATHWMPLPPSPSGVEEGDKP